MTEEELAAKAEQDAAEALAAQEAEALAAAEAQDPADPPPFEMPDYLKKQDVPETPLTLQQMQQLLAQQRGTPEPAEEMVFTSPDYVNQLLETKLAQQRDQMIQMFGTMQAPAARAQAVQVIGKGLNEEAQKAIDAKLANRNAIQIADIMNDPDSIDTLRNVGENVHRKTSTPKVSAPASEGRGVVSGNTSAAFDADVKDLMARMPILTKEAAAEWLRNN